MIYLDTALTNLSQAFTNLQVMITAVAYVAGFIMCSRGILMLRAFGQHITQMSQKGEVAGPLVYLVVGGFLIYLPSTLDTSFMTLFGKDTSGIESSSALLAYLDVASEDKYRQILDIMVKYTKLIGLVAFLRGWFIMAKMGDPGVQPGSMAKGITHLASGIMLMNIVGTFKLLADTIGWSA